MTKPHEPSTSERPTAFLIQIERVGETRRRVRSTDENKAEMPRAGEWDPAQYADFPQPE